MAVTENSIIRSPDLHEARFERVYDLHIHVDDCVAIFCNEAHCGLGAARRVGFGVSVCGVVLPLRPGGAMRLRRGILRAVATAVRIRLRLIGVSRVSSKITLHAGCGHFRVVGLGLGAA